MAGQAFFYQIEILSPTEPPRVVKCRLPKITVGRGDHNHIVLNSKEINWEELEIEFSDGQVYINRPNDIESKRVSSSVQLKKMQHIEWVENTTQRVGNYELRYRKIQNRQYNSLEMSSTTDGIHHGLTNTYSLSSPFINARQNAWLIAHLWRVLVVMIPFLLLVTFLRWNEFNFVKRILVRPTATQTATMDTTAKTGMNAQTNQDSVAISPTSSLSPTVTPTLTETSSYSTTVQLQDEVFPKPPQSTIISRISTPDAPTITPTPVPPLEQTAIAQAMVVQATENRQAILQATIAVQPTATITPIPPQPPIALDAPLPQLGTYIEGAIVPPGQPYWKLISAHWLDEQQSDGKNYIIVQVLDQSNNRWLGQTITVYWKDGAIHEVANKADASDRAFEFLLNATGNAYSVRMDGVPSDTIHGLGMGTLDCRQCYSRTSYYLVFKYVKNIVDAESSNIESQVTVGK